MGHSLGGKVAMETTMRQPDLADKLIVVDIAPRAYIAGHDAIIEALMSVPVNSLKTRKEVENLLMEKLNDRGVVLFLMKNLARNEDRSLFWRMNLPVLAEKYAETTKAIESDRTFERPALFVRGGQSKYITDADWNEIALLFPKARLETIAKAGHWVHADAMEELLTVVRDFLTANN